MKTIKAYLYILLTFCTPLCATDSNLIVPSEIAKEEVAAWKDYYDNDVTGLIQHLSHLVIVEFRLNQLTAWTTVIPQLITAAATFKNVPHSAPKETYEKEVLPHLEDAYLAIKNALNGQWDANKAAQLELEWWLYRRESHLSSPEIVGEKIANLYELIYGENDEDHFNKAGYLRAVAARYRDLCQQMRGKLEDSDWQIIENILENSYKEMALGILSNEQLNKKIAEKTKK
jgi:hypothetical protein